MTATIGGGADASGLTLTASRGFGWIPDHPGQPAAVATTWAPGRGHRKTIRLGAPLATTHKEYPRSRTKRNGLRFGVH